MHVLLWDLHLLRRYRPVTLLLLPEINVFCVHEMQTLNVNRTQVVMERLVRRWSRKMYRVLLCGFLENFAPSNILKKVGRDLKMENWVDRNGGSCSGHALCSVVAGVEPSNFTTGRLDTPSPISSVIALLRQFYILYAERNKIFIPGVWL
jgi:hypothetical protein